jgi:hypothetical protein
MLRSSFYHRATKLPVAIDTSIIIIVVNRERKPQDRVIGPLQSLELITPGKMKC